MCATFFLNFSQQNTIFYSCAFFRLFLTAFTFLGAFFDCIVWYYVKDLDLYDEDKNIEARRQATLKKSQGQT